MYKPLFIADEEGVRSGNGEIIHHRWGLIGGHLLDRPAAAVRLANVRANP